MIGGFVCACDWDQKLENQKNWMNFLSFAHTHIHTCLNKRVYLRMPEAMIKCENVCVAAIAIVCVCYAWIASYVLFRYVIGCIEIWFCEYK